MKVGDKIYYIQGYFNWATLKSFKAVKCGIVEYVGETLIEADNGTVLAFEKCFETREQAEKKLVEEKK